MSIVHISYYRGPDNSLKRAWKDDAGWHFETIEGPGPGGYVHFWSSLLIDASGNLHISYASPFGAPNKRLRYAYTHAAGWHPELAESGKWVFENSLVMSSGGFPHIAYYEMIGGVVKYAYKNGGWNVEVVANGAYCSLALDSSDVPYVSYGRAADGNLMCAYKNGGWTYDHVDAAAVVGARNTSIVIDASDYPHIAYWEAGGGDLKYAYKDGGGWTVEPVDSAGNVGQGPSLVLDGDGYPHISYSDQTNHKLKYAYKDGGGWHKENADDVRVYYTTSLALDESSYPHISYMDAILQDLKYAHKDAIGWHAETVDDVGGAGYYSSLVLEAVPVLGAYTYFILA